MLRSRLASQANLRLQRRRAAFRFRAPTHWNESDGDLDAVIRAIDRCGIDAAVRELVDAVVRQHLFDRTYTSFQHGNDGTMSACVPWTK